MNIFSKVIILSAERSENRHEKNRQLTENLDACLSDCNFNYSRAIGVYEGNEESSFVVLPKNEDELNTLKNLAFKSFGQESILYQDANGKAYLLFSDNSEKSIGKLRQVNPTLIEKLENYTILNGKVYTTEKVYNAN